MEKTFNAQAQGSSLAQKRAPLYPKFDAAQQPRKTMIEQQQSVPVLKPNAMGAAQVDRAIYRQQLRQDDAAARAKRCKTQHSEPQKSAPPRAIANAFNQKKQTQSWV